MGPKDGAGVVADVDGAAKGGGDAIGGDVVMRGAYAARGEEMVEPGAERPDRRGDGGGIVGDHAHFLEVDAVLGQRPRKVMHVGVTGAPREDFIPDDKHGGGGVGHGASFAWRT